MPGIQINIADIDDILNSKYMAENNQKEESFYLNETFNLEQTDPKIGSDDELSVFAGNRDIQDLKTLQEKKIISEKGTVRGYKNRVRAGIATFIEQKPTTKNFKTLEKNKIVLYTTTMQIIRQTYDQCQKTRRILQTHMVKFEEKDIFMNRENQMELRDRLGQMEIIVPQVFIDGQLLADADKLTEMNENGELRKLLKQFTKVSQTDFCKHCGGYRYVPCKACRGSKKSFHRNNFTEEFCYLRCIICDENGLVRCDVCNVASNDRKL